MLNKIIYSFHLILLLGIFNISLAQREADNWVIAKNIQLQFGNNKNIKVVNPNSKWYYTDLYFNEANSSISDSNGNLIMYSSGDYLFDNKHNIIANIQWNSIIRESASQGILILKHPLSKEFHIFGTAHATRWRQNIPFIHYSLKQSKDTFLFTNKGKQLVFKTSEKLNAVNHQNKRDIWVATHSSYRDTFYFHLLKKNGLVCCPIKQSIGEKYINNSQSGGKMKFSINGTTLIVANLGLNSTELFRFNNESAKLFNPIILNDRSSYGVEISPNNLFIYVNNIIEQRLIQYDISKWNKVDILNSKYIIFDTTTTSLFFHMGLQINKNGTLYGNSMFDSLIYEIKKPNLKGSNANFVKNSISLPNKGIHNMLPNFNQSYFYQPAVDYAYEQECSRNSIQFWGEDTLKSTSQQWLIKKGAITEATYNTVNINHTFKDTGKYQVSYIVSGTVNDTVTKTITIYPTIKPAFLGNDTFYCKGTQANILLKTPKELHCIHWYKDSTTTEISRADSLIVDTAGTYYVKVTNKSFCVYWDTIVVSINNPKLTVSLSPKKDSCILPPIKLQAKSTNNKSNTYEWYLNGKIQLRTDSLFILTYDAMEFTHRSKVTVVVKVKDYCYTAADTFTVYQKPIINASITPIKGCVPLSVSVLRKRGQLNTREYWEFGGLFDTVVLYKYNYTFTQVRNYPIKYTVTHKRSQCKDSLEWNIAVYPNPIASFTFTPIEPTIGDSIVTFKNRSTGVNTYQWHFGDGTKSTQTNPKYNYTQQGAYTIQLIATSNKGCADTTEQGITVYEQGRWYLPSALHLPNEDNPLAAARGNDVFKPVGVGIKSYHIYIVSRWGKIMHNRNIPYHPKPGTLQGNYYFHVKVVFENGKTDEKKGSLFILD